MVEKTLAVPVEDRFAAFENLADHVGLNENQKAIIGLSLSSPKLTKKQISEQLQTSITVVYDVFYSKAYERLVKSVAEKEKKGLLSLAVLTLRECLTCSDDKVRLNAALRILEDSGEIKKVPSISKTDNKMIVVWQDKTPIQSVIEVGDAQVLPELQ